MDIRCTNNGPFSRNGTPGLAVPSPHRQITTFILHRLLTHQTKMFKEREVQQKTWCGFPAVNKIAHFWPLLSLNGNSTFTRKRHVHCSKHKQPPLPRHKTTEPKPLRSHCSLPIKYTIFSSTPCSTVPFKRTHYD